MCPQEEMRKPVSEEGVPEITVESDEQTGLHFD